jgi:nicotinamidase-related amidase
MASNSPDEDGHRRATIGTGKDAWAYDSSTGFDLTRQTASDRPSKPGITIETTTAPVTIDPQQTSLVIIDMQNYFLSTACDRARGKGHDALAQLVEHAIPACRDAEIRVVWLNWGLDDDDLISMPPALLRCFGFASTTDDGTTVPADRHGNPRTHYHMGLGTEIGRRYDDNTKQEVDAGRVLVRDQWNTALYPPLDRIFAEGKALPTRPDVWIHKNRLSGMWGASTPCEAFLEQAGIKTLLFAGVNTDQCVGGTLTDAFSKGYDCILLSDGSGTGSPAFAQQCMEFNGMNSWGFVTTCRELAEGVQKRKGTL